jgi:hypothetical protein
MKNAKAVEYMGALGCRHFPGGQVSDIRRIVELRRSRSGDTPPDHRFARNRRLLPVDAGFPRGEIQGGRILLVGRGDVGQ